MNKIYMLALISLFSFTSCQNKDKNTTDSEFDSDTIVDGVNIDSTAISSEDSEVELLDTIATKTTTITTDSSKGKYALAETKWKLVELMGKEVKNESSKEYFINLDSKTGKFSTYVGCNTIIGNYLMKDSGLLSFSKVGGTKMACSDMDFENKYIKGLEKVDNYMIEGSMLHLHKGKRNAFAKFEANR